MASSVVLSFFFKQKTAYEMRISELEFRRVLFRSRGLLRPAAGRPGAGLRRQLADRLARPRPAGARPAGNGRARRRRRSSPHRHADDGSARTRAPRRGRPTQGLALGLRTRMLAAARTTLQLVDANLYGLRARPSKPEAFSGAGRWQHKGGP